jgi:hypothetical protein
VNEDDLHEIGEMPLLSSDGLPEWGGVGDAIVQSADEIIQGISLTSTRPTLGVEIEGRRYMRGGLR